MDGSTNVFAGIPIARDRELFLLELLGELSRVLEGTVGLKEAEGFISLVGARIGERMNAEYREALGVKELDVSHVAEALVDLKRRIEGGFSIESIDEDRIVLVNTACPFGRHAVGHPSLCMMTSNVFGRIAADNLGYVRVELLETIAEGGAGCRVVVHLNEGGAGREYFG